MQFQLQLFSTTHAIYCNSQQSYFYTYIRMYSTLMNYTTICIAALFVNPSHIEAHVLVALNAS